MKYYTFGELKSTDVDLKSLNAIKVTTIAPYTEEKETTLYTVLNGNLHDILVKGKINSTKLVYKSRYGKVSVGSFQYIFADIWRYAEVLFFTNNSGQPTDLGNMPNTSNAGSKFSGSCGADPEFFITDKKGKVIPAWELFPARKVASYPEDPYWDGVQGEFTVKESNCLSYAIDSVYRGLLAAHNKVKDSQYEITSKSTFKFRRSTLKGFDKEHVELGCKPSFNAYDSPSQLTGENPYNVLVRSAGFHLHFGSPCLTWILEPLIKKIVTLMDLLAGIPSVYILDGLEDPRRRLYYGRAGEYRLPKHGLEYRVLSSSILVSPVYVNMFFELARAAIHCIQAERSLTSLRVSAEDIRDIINTHDIDGAKKVTQEIVLPFALDYFSNRYSYTFLENLKYLLSNKASDVFKNTTVAKEWRLDNVNYNNNYWQTHCESPNTGVGNFIKRLKTMEASG